MNKTIKNTGLIVLIVALIILPYFVAPVSNYWMHVFILTLMHISIAATVRLVMETGQLTAGHAAFMAIGGYTSAMLSTHLGLSFWITIFASGMVSAFIGFLIGLPTLKVKGIYFVVVTFAFNEIVRLIIGAWSWVGGYTGISNVPFPNPIFGMEFGSKTSFYYLILAITIIIVLVMYRIDKSRIGRTLIAVEHNDALSESLGINVMRYKTIAFVISTFFVGMVGAFFVHYLQLAHPENYTILQSIFFLIYVQVGGVATIWGPIIGGAFMTLIPEALRITEQWQTIVFPAIFLLVVYFLPDGIISLPKVFRRKDELATEMSGGN